MKASPGSVSLEAPPDFVHLRVQRPDVQRLRMPCATIRPWASKIAKVKSWLSLMMVEVARPQHVERELASDLQGRLVDHFEIDGVQMPLKSRNVAAAKASTSREHVSAICRDSLLELREETILLELWMMLKSR